MTSIKPIIRLTSTWLYRIFFVTLFVVTKSANYSWFELMAWKLSHVIESSSHKNERVYVSVCVSVCVFLSSTQILNLPEIVPHGKEKKKKDRLEANKKLIILSYPVRKLCVFERPFSLLVYHFREVLKNPPGNFLYLDLFFIPKEKSPIWWYIWVRIYCLKKWNFFTMTHTINLLFCLFVCFSITLYNISATIWISIKENKLYL